MAEEAPPPKKSPSAKPVAHIRKSAATAPVAGIAVPPPAVVAVAIVRWSTSMAIHRVHLDKYAGDQFNPGLVGNARFSPIKNAAGEPIPTLYGGSSFACAAMESVFHDVPYAPGLKTLDKAKLHGQVHSQLEALEELLLADFSSRALRKFGVARSQLIDTEKDQYPVTRQWAEAVHRDCPEAQGICWTSRQDDGALALIVFGDRLEERMLKQSAASRNLVNDHVAYGELLVLAEQIGVDIVPGSTPA